MRPIYLLGPSGVGKTTIADRLAEQCDVQHKDLDRLLAHCHPARQRIEVAQDWSIVGPLLEALDTSDAADPLVVTLGAGTQDIDRARSDRRLEEWLQARANRVIFLKGSPDEIFARSVAHVDHRDRFDCLEYGPDRLRLYAIAQTAVDIGGLTLDEAVRCVGDAVREVAQGKHPSAE